MMGRAHDGGMTKKPMQRNRVAARKDCDCNESGRIVDTSQRNKGRTEGKMSAIRWK